jgi:hypothetical protein
MLPGIYYRVQRHVDAVAQADQFVNRAMALARGRSWNAPSLLLCGDFDGDLPLSAILRFMDRVEAARAWCRWRIWRTARSSSRRSAARMRPRRPSCAACLTGWLCMRTIAARGRVSGTGQSEPGSWINMTCGPTGRCGNTAVSIGRAVARGRRCTTMVATASRPTLAISTARRSGMCSTARTRRWLRFWQQHGLRLLAHPPKRVPRSRRGLSARAR